MPLPIADSEIRLTEGRLNVVLPPKYRDRMTRSNGGSILTDDDSWEMHPLADKSDEKRMRRTTNNVEYETREAKQKRGFPVDALAIGSNGCGDVLILLPDEAAFGEVVYRWNHETCEVERLADDITCLGEDG